MVEIKKISVKKDKKTIINNLSLKIENGKISIVNKQDDFNEKELLKLVNNDSLYEFKVDDISFNDKPLKSMLNNIQTNKKIIEDIDKETNLLYENSFKLSNNKEETDDLLSYILEKSGNIETVVPLTLPEIDFDKNALDINDENFFIKSRVINNKGFSVIQLIGLVISMGLIILTATKVYSAVATASSVSYSNTSSGLSANNVQDAIDKTYKNVSELCTNKYLCFDRSSIRAEYALNYYKDKIIIAQYSSCHICISASSASTHTCDYYQGWLQYKYVGDTILTDNGSEYGRGNKPAYLWSTNYLIGYCQCGAGCFLY